MFQKGFFFSCRCQPHKRIMRWQYFIFSGWWAGKNGWGSWIYLPPHQHFGHSRSNLPSCYDWGGSVGWGVASTTVRWGAWGGGGSLQQGGCCRAAHQASVYHRWDINAMRRVWRVVGSMWSPVTLGHFMLHSLCLQGSCKAWYRA